MKRVTFERGFLYHMIKKFLRVLDTVPLKGIDGYPWTCLWKITYKADCRHNLHVVYTAIEQSYSVQNDTAWLLLKLIFKIYTGIFVCGLTFVKYNYSYL